MTSAFDFPLYVPPEQSSGQPFEGDLFQRSNLAERLTGFVQRLDKTGGVIAIDAPWGDGKTWFVENWERKLKKDGYKTAFLNLFKHDHVDDPFAMLCSEVIAQLDLGPNEKDRLLEKGKVVAKTLIPLMTKALITYGMKSATGFTPDEFNEAMGELSQGLGDQAKEFVADTIKQFEDDKKSMEAFLGLLTEYASALEKPLVVFIDELDRCRPDFAVRTIERIKHFFDVPKIIFVLSVNRTQLTAYVRGIYGIQEEANQYLNKFILFWLKLPKARSLDYRGLDHGLIYCNELARKYGVSQLGETTLFSQLLAVFANKLSLTLRDLERGFTLYSLSMPLKGVDAILLSWPIVLKLTKPNVFYGVLSGNSDANKEAINILHSVNNPSGKYSLFIDFFIELHTLDPGSDLNHAEHLTQESQNIIVQISSPLPSPWVSDPAGYIPWLFGKIDINVER